MSGVASTRPAPTLEGLAELARLSLDGSSEAIERILSLARAALDMDVAVVGAFDGDFVVQAVDGENEWFDLEVGSRIPVEQGDLPTLVHDAVADVRTADLPITRESGIGAYIGVPIRLWDGTLYGTLCCLSRSPEPSLNVRDVRFLRVLAEIVADQVDREQLESEKRRLEWSRIRGVLDRDDIDVEFQPVFDLDDCTIVSLEALARFWTEPMRSPSVWFAEATEVGLGVELELAAIRSALQRLDEFPPGVAIALNVSPTTALDSRFGELLVGVADRVVIEITEHAQVDDYDALRTALAPLRERGAQLAIDDVGAGF
ncbi:MAG: EAL domain-containing protein, partial [Chloroflexi bacterium]